MVVEKFQIYGVKITGKYICESKKKLDLYIFTHVPKQNSTQGYYHPADRRKLPISHEQHILKVFFPQQKEGRVMELKKMTKMFLVSVLLCHNLD